MRIVNGRTLGDSLGSFTCHQYSGSSTVDYAIVEKSLYDLVKYFKVGKYMPDLSDHCVIELCIKSDLKYLLNQKEDMNYFFKTYKYTWKSEYKDKYQTALHNVTDQLNDLLTTSQENNVDNMIENFNNILHNVCDHSLLNVKNKKNHTKYIHAIHRKINKKWFDKDCYKMRKFIRKNPPIFYVETPKINY